jgi:hypothetical protein
VRGEAFRILLIVPVIGAGLLTQPAGESKRVPASGQRQAVLIRVPHEVVDQQKQVCLVGLGTPTAMPRARCDGEPRMRRKPFGAHGGAADDSQAPGIAKILGTYSNMMSSRVVTALPPTACQRLLIAESRRNPDDSTEARPSFPRAIRTPPHGSHEGKFCADMVN